LTAAASAACQNRAVTRINGYPHSFYLVGVAIVFTCAALGSALAGLIGFDGWALGAIWLGFLIVGFGVARRVNARLFRSNSS
jgi:hypothetical protein